MFPRILQSRFEPSLALGISWKEQLQDCGIAASGSQLDPGAVSSVSSAGSREPKEGSAGEVLHGAKVGQASTAGTQQHPSARRGSYRETTRSTAHASGSAVPPALASTPLTTPLSAAACALAVLGLPGVEGGPRYRVEGGPRDRVEGGPRDRVEGGPRDRVEGGPRSQNVRRAFRATSCSPPPHLARGPRRGHDGMAPSPLESRGMAADSVGMAADSAGMAADSAGMAADSAGMAADSATPGGGVVRWSTRQAGALNVLNDSFNVSIRSIRSSEQGEPKGEPTAGSLAGSLPPTHWRARLEATEAGAAHLPLLATAAARLQRFDLHPGIQGGARSPIEKLSNRYDCAHSSLAPGSFDAEMVELQRILEVSPRA